MIHVELREEEIAGNGSALNLFSFYLVVVVVGYLRRGGQERKKIKAPMSINQKVKLQ